MKKQQEKIAKSIIEAREKNFVVTTAVQAHIALNFEKLFNDKFTLNVNVKTDRIPAFNLPNIMLQGQFLQFVKNNEEKIQELVPADEKNDFAKFVEYMKNNAMCKNCGTCSQTCYNNKAYIQYPTKGICDLRQLYRIVKNADQVVEDLVDATINTKIVRLNGSGEIHNELILDVYKKVAEQNPDTKYYTYTKNFELLKGCQLPGNLCVNLSDYGTTELVQKYRNDFPAGTNVFKAVTAEEFEKLEKEGCKTLCYGESCSRCRLCTKRTADTIYCKIH